MIPYEVLLLLKGVLSGFLVSFISMTSDLYTANYVLARNWVAGFVAALGLTLVQFAWAIVAVFSLRISLTALHANMREFALFGSIILIVMAVRLYRREKRRQKNIPARPTKLPYVFFEAVLFALSSPGKIIAYAAFFITIGVEREDPGFVARLPLVFGVMIGAIIWWVIYIFGINAGRHRISGAFVSRLQKLAACVLIGFAIYGIIAAFTKL